MVVILVTKRNKPSNATGVLELPVDTSARHVTVLPTSAVT